jgi:stage II sporulation protein D
VLLHEGGLIDAYFFSTCGFQTAAVREAFATVTEQPYLRPVSDRIRGERYYCDISPRFRWREEWEGASLRDILRNTLAQRALAPGDPSGTLREIRIAATGRSGRVTELVITLGDDHVRVSGPDVRAVLRPAPDRILGSTAFQLHPTIDMGEVKQMVAAGAGWGHGVGLCQWGAVGRARAGQNYESIVTTYFPGTTLARLY